MAIEKVRLSGETEIELASGEAANCLDPHAVLHRPDNGQSFTTQ